ncbi:MAG: hypothetical protein GF363_10855, partial [Chitinivibrionales bacterium]|nr:hypothetical protein [Chitinivibrionales bacterium]
MSGKARPFALTPVFATILAAGVLTVLLERTSVTKTTQWSIGIYSGPTPFDLSPSSLAQNPVLTADDVTDVRAEFVADPFMIQRDTIWYMFFEVMNAGTGQGDIGLALSTDGHEWRYDGIVLDEPFHLSYPHVFSWEREHYLVPESHRDRTVRLYKASYFPYGWTVVDTLIHGYHVDPTVFRRNGKWWLFVSNPSRDILRLFWAFNLTDEWREHSASPIVRDNPHSAQPAGRFVPWEGGFIRFAQDGKPTYGKMVYAFIIRALSESTYV